MRWLLIAGLSLVLLSGCGGKHEKKVENLYQVKALEFSRDGVAAMRIERWSLAERAFDRSLKAAQLADDTGLVVQAWYNLGAVRAAREEDSAAEAYRQADALAGRYALPEMQMRARLSLALWQARHHEDVAPVDMSGRWPADIELMAGRLAQLQHTPASAKAAYELVLHRAGKDAAGLNMQAEAHAGLALLARDSHDVAGVRDESDKALDLCRQTGAPRLTAHLLLLRASVPGVSASPEDEAERAYAIYQALSDSEGQAQSLRQLKKLALDAGNTTRAAGFEAKLEALGNSRAETTNGKEKP